MRRLNTSQFFDFINRGGLRGGDILFVATPFGKGHSQSNAVKFGQFFCHSSYQHDPYGSIPHGQFTHVVIVVQSHSSTFIAESAPPRTRNVSLPEFFGRFKDREFALFRTNLSPLACALNYYGPLYASCSIPYLDPISSLLSLKSKIASTQHRELPNATNCCSFVSFVYDVACRNLPHNLAPMNYARIAPYQLYEKFKMLEHEEYSWQEILQVSSRAK